MNRKKKIYLINHGETNYSIQNILEGGNTDESLTSNGRQQAEAFYENYRTVPFKKIYTSTLKRSIESVENFIVDGVAHESIKELDEIRYGVYDGEIHTGGEDCPYYTLINKWENGNLTAKLDGGESPIQIREKQERFLRRLFLQQDEDSILICMHTISMQIFLTHVLYYNLSHMNFFPCHKMGLYVLNYSDYMYFIEKFNDTSHLINSHALKTLPVPRLVY